MPDPYKFIQHFYAFESENKTYFSYSSSFSV